jgi:hypothetical protein
MAGNSSHVVERLNTITLLLKISEQEVSVENQFLAKLIVDEVDHLPLVLAHAGGCIAVPTRTLACIER